jgi:membrane protease YdiL (CAAX protease family)
MVVLGALVTLGMYLWGRSTHAEPATLIRNGLLITFGFYVFVGAVVVARAQKVAFRPVWTEGDPTDSLLHGLLLGGGVGFGLLVLTNLASGRLTADPGITQLVSERTPVRILAAVLLACVAAPWVEELLFRGLLAESQRPKGVKAAALGSAVLFAAWHPQALYPLLDSIFSGFKHMTWAPFLYYIGMGTVFARLYFKRGLKSSIAAHTAFNGIIVLAAIVSVSGASHLVAARGVEATVPGTWRLNTEPLPNPGIDMVVDGPSGAQMVVLHLDIPPGVTVTADTAAEKLAAGLDLPGVEVQPGTTRRVDYPMGQAVRLSAKAQGHAAEIIMVPKGGVVWEVLLATGGSKRASQEFDQIIQKVRLPEA